jgi:hypothetical protein
MQHNPVSGVWAMNTLRVILNVALAIVLLSGGVYLLGQDSFLLSERWNPEAGTLFQGVVLYCLASGLILHTSTMMSLTEERNKERR